MTDNLRSACIIKTLTRNMQSSWPLQRLPAPALRAQSTGLADKDAYDRRALPARRVVRHHRARHQPAAVGGAPPVRHRREQARRQRQPGRRPRRQVPARRLHLLLCDVGALAISPSVYTKLPFDPSKDLRGVTMLAYSPHLLVVHPVGEGQQPQGTGRAVEDRRT